MSKQSHGDDCKNPDCDWCKLRKSFVLPKEIVEAYEADKLVFFAGAGISTETRKVSSAESSLQGSVKAVLGIKDSVPFPKLMSLYCESPRSRKDLLCLIKSRIDFIKNNPSMYDDATEFHREICTIPRLNEIITTNWDDFFERECSATPIVTGQDFAVFEGVSGRKVFKIHGSVNSFGSIVANEDDYKKCYEELSTGIIGAKLKLLLISKTVVFVGFSFEDEDFKKIYQMLKTNVAGEVPRSYVVTLDENASAKIDALGLNTTPIITSAAYFAEILKKRLIDLRLMVPDENFVKIKRMRSVIAKEVIKIMTLKPKEHPIILHTFWYQFGLIYMFDHLTAIKNSGRYSHPHYAFLYLEFFGKLSNIYISKKNYEMAAMAIGYQKALEYFLFDDSVQVSKYFLFGYDKIINDYESYKDIALQSTIFSVEAQKSAEDAANSLASDNVFPGVKPLNFPE